VGQVYFPEVPLIRLVEYLIKYCLFSIDDNHHTTTSTFTIITINCVISKKYFVIVNCIGQPGFSNTRVDKILNLLSILLEFNKNFKELIRAQSERNWYNESTSI